jgi:hypothetical protein
MIAPDEKVQFAIKLLAVAVLSLLQNHPNGLRNIEVADGLGLRSSQGDSQKNQWSWQTLRRLCVSGRVKFDPTTKLYSIILL